MKRKTLAISLLTILSVTTAIGQHTSKETVRKPAPPVAEQTEVYKEIFKVEKCDVSAF